jgi:hypothetical protein
MPRWEWTTSASIEACPARTALAGAVAAVRRTWAMRSGVPPTESIRNATSTTRQPSIASSSGSSLSRRRSWRRFWGCCSAASPMWSSAMPMALVTKWRTTAGRPGTRRTLSASSAPRRRSMASSTSRTVREMSSTMVAMLLMVRDRTRPRKDRKGLATMLCISTAERT